VLLQIRHETVYEYLHPVSYSIQTLKLTPRADPGQRIVSWRLFTPGERLEQVDPFGNVTHLVTVDAPHRTMRIVVEGVTEIEPPREGLLEAEGGLSPLAFLAPTALTRSNAGIAEFAERHLGRHPPAASALLDLATGIRAAVIYEPGITDVTHSAIAALELGAGVCQDQAHVLVACCRALRIPARYVSGYFHTGDAGEVASHAWADVWIESERGWLSIDVTHGQLAGERHCRLAVGRDYLDAAPVRGLRRGGGEETMKVTVQLSTGQGQQQ
jgi:transglutaminase-like putative cysteine protease